MIKKLENDYLSIDINEKGAELFSIKSKKTNIEYLWQGDDKFWGDRALTLFPICGRLFGGKYFYNGKEYQMPIHGIAKLFEFKSNVISAEKVEFTLCSNDETKGYYPFDFIFSVVYTLKGDTLHVEYIAKNTGENEMLFSHGGHPGFNVPFTKNEKFDDYYLEFTKEKLTKHVFSDTCFFTGKTNEINLDDKKLMLKHNLFDNDALFFETETDKVKLKNKITKNAVEVSYNGMTCLGIWHNPKVEAPFVCIEPWHGIPSTDGVIDEFETKNHMIKLGSGKTYSNEFTIKIVEE